MKFMPGDFKTEPLNGRILYWAKLFSITGFSQILIQVASFICGIFIIRSLPVNEYGLYTIANTILSSMVILSDSGAANGVMAEAGKVWQDRSKMGVVFATGMEIRKKFGVVSLLLLLPVLIYLLQLHNASWITIGLICISIIPAFWASLSDSFLEIIPKLHQEVKDLQKNQLEVGFGRLVLTVLLLLLFPFTFIALIANGISRIYGNFKLRKISERKADLNSDTDIAVRRNILYSVKRTLPTVIYYCLSSQIAIWLVSFFGKTDTVSEMGALGRLAVVFTICGSFFSILVVPRYSRIKAESVKLVSLFNKTILLATSLSVIVFILVWIFSDVLLWVLGNNYTGLKNELLLSAAAGALGFLLTLISQLSTSRGWFIQPWYIIAINLITTVVCIFLINFSSLRGILYFNIAINLSTFLLVFFYGIYKAFKSDKEYYAVG